MIKTSVQSHHQAVGQAAVLLFRWIPVSGSQQEYHSYPGLPDSQAG
jgi:hypothetical protein